MNIIVHLIITVSISIIWFQYICSCWKIWIKIICTNLSLFFWFDFVIMVPYHIINCITVTCILFLAVPCAAALRPCRINWFKVVYAVIFSALKKYFLCGTKVPCHRIKTIKMFKTFFVWVTGCFLTLKNKINIKKNHLSPAKVM